jgi:ElaB/YqjD/DUF883 family membrane-anchored ribosome-binding protein
MAKDTFDRTRDFVEQKIDQTKELLGDRYQKGREKVDDLLAGARDNWRGVSGRLDDEWGNVSKEVKKYVKANPVLSLAIAASAGFLLGLLIGRRDD